MKLYQKILIGVLAGIFILPTFAIGGSITVSLIQGKGVPEALEILAEQIDSLVGRLEIVETKQVAQEENVSGLQSNVEQQEQTIEEQKSLIEQLQEEQENIKSQLNEEPPPPEPEPPKATSIITIYNDYSASSQMFVEATRFIHTETDLMFKNIETLTVPGNGENCIGSINVVVRADKPGPEYLLNCSETQPCNFAIPGFKGTQKYTGFYAKSFSNFTFEEITDFPRVVNSCD